MNKYTKYIHAFFSKIYANKYGATIATQPNDNHILITHWSDDKETINQIKLSFPDVEYVGDVVFGFTIMAENLTEEPNVLFEKYITKNVWKNV